jgi:hypothetical protein
VAERPGTFISIGLNHSDHAAGVGLPIPDEPIGRTATAVAEADA